MVELKEKTVEELRKMASKKKVEGRSKMNKTELVKALKKSIKRRKMNGGALTEDQITMLLSRNYQENPMLFRRNNKNGTLKSEEQILKVVRGRGHNTHMIGVITDKKNLFKRDRDHSLETINFFTISDDGSTLIHNPYIYNAPPPPRYSAPPPPRYSASPPPRYSASPPPRYSSSPPPRYSAPPPPRYSAPPPPRYSAPTIPSIVQNAYLTLKVDIGADFKSVVKPAYRALVLKLHPNKGGSADLFRPIQEAYEKIEQYEENKKSHSTSFR